VLGADLTTKAEIKGAALEHSTYRHPLYERGKASILIGGDYMTTESGTGLVHTAPGHGEEDFRVGQRYGLPMLCPVDERGDMTDRSRSLCRVECVERRQPRGDRSSRKGRFFAQAGALPA
jgi:isoleucyl-tRNA synthetase